MRYLFLTTLFVILQSPGVLSANSKDFEEWKKNFAYRYGKKGTPKHFILKHLRPLKYQPKIIKRDRNQVTRNKSLHFPSWVKKWLGNKPTRIEEGKKLLKKNEGLLQRVEDRYGVEKEIIVSLIGIETRYGRIMGTFPIIESLATLAFDKRRRKFFEKELFHALRILYQGHISKKDFKGSWAGAFGQCQFMPSSFHRLAVDFDGDGKKDIWKNKGDIFASVANYLKKAGWKKGKDIGKFTWTNRQKSGGLKRFRFPAQINEPSFDQGNKKGLVKIALRDSPLIVKKSNYSPILRWNHSSLFSAMNIILFNSLKER